MTGLNYTHNFFPYPAKFPPEPVREHLLKYSSSGDPILDPFCGSGTMLVEAVLSGRDATGIDLNPVSSLISKAKATVYDEKFINELELHINSIEDALQNYKDWIKKTLQDTPLQTYDNIEHWFKPSMIKELTAIKSKLLKHANEDLQRLLWMGFLSMIVACSRQDTDTRYAAVDKPEVKAGFAIKKFLSILNNYLKVLRKEAHQITSSIKSASVHEGDSSIVLASFPKNSFQLAITSPPYINTFDYYLYHKHRIFWMDKNPREVRKKEIGCHHKIDTQTFENALNDYTESLSSILDGLQRTLVKNGRSIWLIGDGIVKKEVIKADRLLREISKKTGFVVEEVDTIDLRSVSRGFIKGRTLDLKKHHTVILKKK